MSVRDVNENRRDRRAFLLGGVASLSRFMLTAISERIVKTGGGGRYLRPPGAIDEAAFLLTCEHCGRCGDACPVNAIQFVPAQGGAGMGTPYISVQDQPCELCLDCVTACPTGALEAISDPLLAGMGTAIIDAQTCLAHQGQACDACYQRCPFPGVALELVDGKPNVLAECVGCGLCVQACVSNPGSIQIQPGR